MLSRQQPTGDIFQSLSYFRRLLDYTISARFSGRRFCKEIFPTACHAEDVFPTELHIKCLIWILARHVHYFNSMPISWCRHLPIVWVDPRVPCGISISWWCAHPRPSTQMLMSAHDADYNWGRWASPVFRLLAFIENDNDSFTPISVYPSDPGISVTFQTVSRFSSAVRLH